MFNAKVTGPAGASRCHSVLGCLGKTSSSHKLTRAQGDRKRGHRAEMLTNNVLQEWRGWLDNGLDDQSSRWRSTQHGLVRTSALLGDHLVMNMREAAQAGNGGKGLAKCASELMGKLRGYESESRLLIKLADTGRVVEELERCTETAIDLLGLRGSCEAETWRQQLREERDQQLKLYQGVLTDEVRLRAEMEDELQQVEVQTLLKNSLKKYHHLLTPEELDATSMAFDVVVQTSGIVVTSLPDWFATTKDEWPLAQLAYFDGGEEACLCEASMLAELQHPHLLKFYGACHVGKNPFVARGESSWVERYCFRWKLLLGCARGILYVHERGLVHRRLELNELLESDKAGVLSGLGLIWNSAVDGSLRESVDDEIPSESVERRDDSDQPSTAKDVLALGIAVFAAMQEHRPKEKGFRWFHSSDMKPLPDSKPDFVNDDEWQLLQGMCTVDPTERFSMLDVVHQMAVLADQEHLSTESQETGDETVTDLNQYQVASLGQTLGDVLDDAAMWCNDADPEIAAVQRPVSDRLMDVYEQLLASTSPLPLRLVDQFSDIVRRFCITLERRNGDSYSYSQSSVGALCASRTIAGRNYGLHYEIDRLLRDNAMQGLVRSGEAHQWQPSWKKVSQRHRQTLKTVVESPSAILESMENEADRSEALALLQSEAQSTGLRVSGAVAALPPWFIPPHRVQLGRHIADGSFGAVYEGMYLDSPVVVKQMLMPGLGKKERQQFRQEADLWFSLNHFNLVKMYGACHEGRPFFVCERAVNGTIVEYARKLKYPDLVWQMLWWSSLGLKHLHDHGIVHGDLKGNNILVGKNWERVKLADFGLSFASNRTDSATAADGGALGAFRWKAPEVLQGGKVTFASDIYSLGMCIIETVTGKLPWGNSIPDKMVKHNVVERRLIPQRPKGFSDEQWGLVTRMCCYDPEERITVGAVEQILRLCMRSRWA